MIPLSATVRPMPARTNMPEAAGRRAVRGAGELGPAQMLTHTLFANFQTRFPVEQAFEPSVVSQFRLTRPGLYT